MESNPSNRCDSCRENLAGWLGQSLSPTEWAVTDAHLAQCPACRQELAALQPLWQGLGQLTPPAPSEQLRPRFYSMLAEFQAEESRETLLQRLQRWLQPLLA